VLWRRITLIRNGNSSRRECGDEAQLQQRCLLHWRRYHQDRKNGPVDDHIPMLEEKRVDKRECRRMKRKECDEEKNGKNERDNATDVKMRRGGLACDRHKSLVRRGRFQTNNPGNVTVYTANEALDANRFLLGGVRNQTKRAIAVDPDEGIEKRGGLGGVIPTIIR
jgi:hypothetical protein